MSFSVMAWLVPAIHVVVYGYGSRCSLAGGAAATLNLREVDLGPTWMTGTSPVMTVRAELACFIRQGRPKAGAELAMTDGGTDKPPTS